MKNFIDDKNKKLKKEALKQLVNYGYEKYSIIALRNLFIKKLDQQDILKQLKNILFDQKAIKEKLKFIEKENVIFYLLFAS